MKQLIYVILLSTSITAFAIHGFDSLDIKEMVVTLPSLDSREMQKNIEIDLHKLPGIKFVDISLSSNTLILNFDSKKFSMQLIEGVLEKWGCNPGEFSFQNVISMK